MSEDDPHSFHALLAQARRGDDRVREQLFNQCREQLGWYARSHVESWLRAKVDASDLVQQTLFEAHRDFARFQGESEGEWIAWLRRILTHNALDLVRQYHGTAKRQARREIGQAAHDHSTWSPPDPVSPEPSLSEQVIARDDQLRIAAALADLPPDYRDVIVLRNLERLPFDEVASQMGRSRPAVQMLWMRAVKKLQQSLGQAEP